MQGIYSINCSNQSPLSGNRFNAHMSRDVLAHCSRQCYWSSAQFTEKFPGIVAIGVIGKCNIQSKFHPKWEIFAKPLIGQTKICKRFSLRHSKKLVQTSFLVPHHGGWHAVRTVLHAEGGSQAPRGAGDQEHRSMQAAFRAHKDVNGATR